MNSKNSPKTGKKLLIAILFIMGQQAVFAVDKDTVDVCPTHVDTTAVKKLDCCADSTVEDHTSAYHKIVKEGGSMVEGMFTVRHIKDAWYWEVPDAMLGRLLLAVTRFTSVPQDFKMFSGEEVNRSAVYLEQYGEKTIFLREYVQSAFAKEDQNIGQALQQSVVDPIVYKFDVIGRNPDTQAQLIDVTKLFMSDNKVTSFSANDRTTLGIGGVQAERTFVDTIKTYPINVEVQTLRTYMMTSGKVPAAQSGFITLSLNTSIVMLPEKPMQARLYDDRVGYFNNKITNFTDDDAPKHEAIISRYRLEPKDVKAYKAGKLVEPKKQIVYYIDPATPKQWVPYLKAGINDWNAAFEAAGFKNAIIAKDWPDDPTMSMDDARFSVLRYLPSETENAYGPRIVDPRSGEIIEAHICWYHNVMSLVRKWYMTQCGPLDKRAQTMNFPDELMGQLIRFVSSHEVGHSLGLRHNMMASQATPVEKLRDKAWVEKYGHTSSIMDYARFNYVAQPEDKIGEKGLFPRINDYDKWAIKWGYQYRPEFKDPVTEKKALRAEVTKVLEGNRRLWWSGDEGKATDPRSQTEDLGDNQMKANAYGMKNLQRVMQNILKWTAQPDGQYDDLSEIHRSARAQYQRYVNHVQRYLGGRYTNNAPGQKPYDFLPRDVQREAVAWLGQYVLETPLWLYPEEVVSKLGIDADDEIRNRQSTLIAMLVSPGLLFTLHNNALRAADPYQVNEYLDDIFALVWKPIHEGDAVQNNYRRQQQRTYVDLLGSFLNPTKDKETGFDTKILRSDVMLYAEQHLDKLESWLKAQPSDAHNKNLLLRINKIRNKYEGKKAESL
jgi:hypothetical protein